MKDLEREEALLIDCEGETLLGILHVPSSDLMQNTAVIMVPAGQLQYRAGCGRQLVQFARTFSGRGFPALRFDLRGAGDSSGDYLGLQHMGAELESVINSLKSVLPNVERVVLWGGCEAASGIMIHSWRHPEVSGWILSNPHIRSQEIRDVAQRAHYLRRLRDRQFWVKLFTFQYNLLGYAKALLSRVGSKLAGLFKSSNSQKSSAAAEDGSEDFMQRMLRGAGKFQGSALMVMSGNSMVRAEFDILLEQSPPWRTAFNAIPQDRVDVPEADQTFSTRPARRAYIEAALAWVENHARQSSQAD